MRARFEILREPVVRPVASCFRGTIEIAMRKKPELAARRRNDRQHEGNHRRPARNGFQGGRGGAERERGTYGCRENSSPWTR